MPSHRLFVSVDLPADLCENVAAVQKPFHELSGLRVTDSDQTHATMKFLGDVEEDRLEEVMELLEDAVSESETAPFDAMVGGLGVFPSFDYISVIWLGVREGASELTELHEALEDQLVAAGFDAEEHDFTPHITIARMDHAGSKERVQEHVGKRDPTVGSFPVESLQLKESTLTPDGPAYSTVSDVSL